MSDIDEFLNILTTEIESLSVNGVYYEVDFWNETSKAISASLIAVCDPPINLLKLYGSVLL